MITIRWRRIFAPILLSLLLFVSACAANPPSRYSQVQKETTQRKAAPAVAKTAEQGSEFNKFFPKSVRGYEIVPTQEKKGFAEYKVKQDGKTVAMLSINDTTSVPSAAAKYQNTTVKIAGYPAIEQGNTTTGVLVNDRYQVKVLSRDPAFTASERAKWIQKFNLGGLARLKPDSSTVTTLPKTTIPNKTTVPKTPVLSPQPAT